MVFVSLLHAQAAIRILDETMALPVNTILLVHHAVPQSELAFFSGGKL
jgi:hypothetical protein